MSHPTDDDILIAATTYRRALEAIDRTFWRGISEEDFPRGACGHCADLLAHHFHGRFDITPEYVLKDFYQADGTWISGHAWLEWNGLIIDITGDQFGWPSVIVTRHSPLHDRGIDRLRYPWTYDAEWFPQQCGGIWHAAGELLKNG